MKYLVLFAVLALVYAIWRSQRALPPDTPDRPSKPRASAPQAMVSCARCGVHLPQSEALQKGGRSYCCAAHRDAPPSS